MRRIVFMLVAVAALDGLLAYTGPASGEAGGETAPIFAIKNPAGIPRLEAALCRARSRQPQRLARHSGQRRGGQSLARRDASLPGRHHDCPTRLELPSVGGK